VQLLHQLEALRDVALEPGRQVVGHSAGRHRIGARERKWEAMGWLEILVPISCPPKYFCGVSGGTSEYFGTPLPHSIQRSTHTTRYPPPALDSMDPRAPLATAPANTAPAAPAAAPAVVNKFSNRPNLSNPSSDVAEALKENNGVSNAVRPWSANHRRHHEGNNIFGADAPAEPITVAAGQAAPVKPVAALKPVAEEEAPRQISAKDLTLPELRTACRERSLNPGGSKPALVERLTDAIAAGGAAPLGSKSEAASVAAGARPGAAADCNDIDAVEHLQQQQQLPAKRQSPGAADDASVSRKAARVAAHGHDIFGASEEKPAAPWAPRADAFLTGFLNSPKKGGDQRQTTVSDAKLRDLGVGRDIFSDGTGSAMKRVRPQSAAFSRSMHGADIFGDAAAAPADADTSDSRKAALTAAARGNGGMVAIAENSASVSAVSPAGVSDAKMREAAGSNIFADQSARKHKPTGKSHVQAASAGNKLFAEDDTDPAAIKFGGKGVSEALKTSLVSKVFNQEDEKMAADAIVAATEGEGNESRCTARLQHNGHGIFSDTWVNGSGGDDEEAEMEEEEAAEGGEGAAADAVGLCTLESSRPISHNL
jgi:hypothetical protein